jgi:hypothetical protein
MPNRIRRPLTLRDLAILVANTAVAFVAARSMWGAVTEYYLHMPFQESRVLYAISAFAAVESVGLIPLFLVPPRPRLRRIVRQPGLVASLAVASAAIVLCLIEGSVAVSHWWFAKPLAFPRPSFLYLANPAVIGPCVVTAWLVLGLIASWRPQPNWPDRLGRAFGAAWIVLAFAFDLYWALRF